MGEGVNGSLKDGHMTAARILRRVAEAKFLVAAVNILFEIATDTVHTSKLRFPRIVLPDTHTDRFAMIPGLIEKPVLQASADHILTDPAPLQTRNSGGGTPSDPGELKRFLFLLFPRLLCRRASVSRRLPDFPAYQCMDRIHQPIAPNLDQIIQSVDTPATAVPVPIIFLVT